MDGGIEQNPAYGTALAFMYRDCGRRKDLLTLTHTLTGGRKGAFGGVPRTFRTRVGTLNLAVPQDREGTFSTQLFARYQRNEKALVLALMQMYVEGVSTRKVKEVTEELCGTSFSKSLVSSLAGSLDSELSAWRNRRLEADAYPYLFVDARYEKARVDGRVVSQGVLVASGRCANRMACGRSSPWRLQTPKARRPTNSCCGP